MSGIAEVLLNLGFRVSGSDLAIGEVCERLERLGANISEGHARSNLQEDVSLLVYSSAVSQENPELLEARRRGIPVVRRAEVLAELVRLKFGIAVAGSHGKTTTTSMIGWILEQAELDPTVIVGGRVHQRASGATIGKGEFLVAESDESDRSFLLLRSTIAVVTNIDHEHLTAYSSFDDLKDSFRQFVEAVPFYGLAVFGIDNSEVSELARHYSRRKSTFGFSADADLRIERVEYSASGSSFVVCSSDHGERAFHVPFPGRHFILNAVAAIAVARELQIAERIIGSAIESFPGVQRRLEVCGEAKGMRVISDYAHHPTEIRATLEAIDLSRSGPESRILAIFQPHRYSRVRDCFEGFCSAFEKSDVVFVMDVYSAGETPIEGMSGRELSHALRHQDARYGGDLHSMIEQVLSEARPGDQIVCLGAGSIGALAHELASKIALQLPKVSSANSGESRASH
ncbi:MAG: UDP-N-acetylmuramate--L-alanine ligase [Bdellovibrionales bacterium]|nr:UDP-N-acetylmuramate--L-alanine ligase [Bdellovibrionales bacterium]